MSLNSKYHIVDTLYENESILIYRAVRFEDHQSVIVKLLKPSSRNENTIAQFVNEQQILSGLSGKISRLLEAVATPSEFFHVFEDMGGRSLHDFLSVQLFTLSEGLSIALKIAETLQYLHQQQIIHGDINPNNIIYNPDTEEIQIVDFGYSMMDNNPRISHEIPVDTLGSLWYISPEQTGRTQNKIDYRSDFYSFGMTLYHLFSGRPPFESRDRFELIHQQVALKPLPLHEARREIPLVLSSIVDKLIEKRPELRYQSDEAIVYDLKECSKLLQTSGEIGDFAIATQDHPALHIGDHLFGRDKEISFLNRIADKAISDGPVHVLISGQLGVGKTRLAEEFCTKFQGMGAHILRGKFEKKKTSLPYLTFKQLFGQLHTFLLSRHYANNEIKIDPKNAGILNHLFLELRDFLPIENKEMFHAEDAMGNKLPIALREFFNQIATPQSPLIILMDDLQWGDRASIQLIEKVVLGGSNPHLHFIGCYRDDEKACQLIEEISNDSRYGFFNIPLLPLDGDALKKMLQVLLDDEGENISSLAAIIHKKTDGNPFFLKTFIQYLYDSKELRFEKGKWVYSLKKINNYSASNNIAVALNAKFGSLSLDEQFYLQHLSLLGNRFDLKLTVEMMRLLGQSPEVMDRLEREGFIEQDGNEYRFVQNQVQQYVYGSLDSKSKKRIHFDIGRFLEHAYQMKGYDDIVTVVAHLNNGYSPDEFPKKLFKLNIKALEEMLLSNVYPQALEQIRFIDTYLYHDDLWTEERGNAFWYSQLKVKILYLNALHDEAFHLVQLLVNKAKNIQERLLCFTMLKNICVTKGEYFDNLIDFGNQLFEELGLSVPLSGKEMSVNVQKLKEKVVSHPLYQNPDNIIHLPPLENRQKQKIASLLADYWEAAYYLSDIPLMQWVCLNLVDTSFRYGNSSESTFGYALFGAQLVSEKEYTKGALFGEAALKLNDEYGDGEMLPKIQNLIANFINPYMKPLDSNVVMYEESLRRSKINGDIVSGTWANFMIHLTNYLSGKSLESVQKNFAKEGAFILDSGDKKMIAIFNILVHMAAMLQDGYEENAQGEKSAIAMWEKEKFYPALAWYAILKAQSCFLDGFFDQGLDYLYRYVHTEANEVIMFPKIRLHFIRALLILSKNSLSERENEVLNSDLAEFEGYVKVSPGNFKFEELLLSAEQMKGKKSPWDTAKEYDNALHEARNRGNSFFAALAALCSSRFWSGVHYRDVSRFYFNEAIVGLNQWGAYEVANRLKRGMILTEEVSESLFENVSNSSQPTNFKSLLKSFYAITQEMDTKELLNTIMKTILENATASSGALIFKKGESFYTNATVDFKRGVIELDGVALDECNSIPKHLIMYAINTGEELILNNPSERGKFKYDPYIRKFKPASCVVIPVSLDGSVVGTLYLENKEVATPLSAETVRTLELLLTQAAIVYKNTLLYETLKISEEKLTKAQEISHVGSWEFTPSNGKNIWSAETYRIYDLEPFGVPVDYDYFLRHLHPDDVGYVTESVKKALSDESSYAIIHRIITDAGTEKTVHQLAEVFWDEKYQKMRGTIQDITEAKQAEELIARLSQVVNQNPFSTIITDTDSVIVYVNRQTLKMTGYTEDELIGKKMNIFRSGVNSNEHYAQLWKTIASDKKIWRGTMTNRMKNNELRDCASTAFPIFDSNNNAINFVTIQEDVTEQNIKEKLFLMQTRQAQMGEMISMIAHQWRQPLAIISALLNKKRVDILLEKSTMEDVAHTFDDIELQVKHLSRTITDFRDFFKPDKEAIETKSSTIVTKALDLIGYSLKQKNIDLQVSYLNDHEYQTFEHEMVQVILNLIKNVQDAFEERKIENPQIVIVTDQHDEVAVMTIEDNAMGIDPEVIDTLFLPYVSTKNQQNGTGLGLYMSKTIVEDHCRGSLRVENTQQGAKFTITIPVKGNP